MSIPSHLIDRLTTEMETAMARRRRPALRRGGLSGLPIAAALAAAVAVVTFVVVSSTTPDGERVASPAQHNAGVDDRPNRKLDHLPPVADAARRFGAALSEGDPVPAGSATARELRQSVEIYGQDPASYEMRQVTFGDGTAVALGVGDRGVCVRVEMPSGGGSMGCAAAAQARLDQPRVAWGTTKRGNVVSGVLPDGVSDLVLYLADGAPVAITPKARFFNVEVDGGLDRLTYRDSAGSERSIRLG
jgi:hypothetical protein